MIPAAPGRLSTITGCLVASVILCPSVRARLSAMPPAASGTIRRTGFAGSPGRMRAERQRQRPPARRAVVSSSASRVAGPGNGFDRIDDRLVAGAAAVIAGEIFADALARRGRLVAPQRLRRPQEAPRAENAFQRRGEGERALQLP